MATFEKGIETILGEGVAIATQRGGEYGDSWALGNLVSTFTRSTLESFGIKVTDEQLRLIQMAALIDVKDARMIGPYKEDSVVDGINYRAVFAYLRRLYDAPKDKPEKATYRKCALGKRVASVLTYRAYNRAGRIVAIEHTSKWWKCECGSGGNNLQDIEHHVKTCAGHK
jgi:hypothetical protein